MNKIKKIILVVLIFMSLFLLTGCEEKRFGAIIEYQPPYEGLKGTGAIRSISDDEIILLLRKQEDILELSEELTITEETYWKWYSDEGRYQSDDTIINSDTVIISSDDSGGKLITHFLGSISTYELDKDIVGFSEVSY